MNFIEGIINFLSAPEILITRVAVETSAIRVGSGGVLLPHYSPMKVAEQFRMLHALYPGRIDLAVGRAPGSGGLESYALQRERSKRQQADDGREVEIDEPLILHRGNLNHYNDGIDAAGIAGSARELADRIERDGLAAVPPDRLLVRLGSAVR